MFFPYADDNPTHITPVVTIGIIALNTAIFLYQLSLPQGEDIRFIYAFGMIPAVLLGDATIDPQIGAVAPELSILTSMFLHGGLMHLFGNMLYLWVFGNNIEESMGHGRFVAFYLLCGLVAAMTQAMIDPDARAPMIGASGAISGVLGAYLVLHPKARVSVLLVIIVFFKRLQFSAGLVLLVWIAFQIFSVAVADPEEGGVAWFAHIGGFVAGMVLIPLMKQAHVPLFEGGRRRGPWG